MSKDIEFPDGSTENLKLWKSVEKTPPDMTKEVAFGKRRFTAVDPQWQMRVATALWGPYGYRWGLRNMRYDMVQVHEHDDKGGYFASAVILQADFFYPLGDKEVSFPVLNEDYFKAGDDTLKKLVTNTRSKALSWLGFSADVFMGKFDDKNYVKDLKVKFGEQDEFVNKIKSAVLTATDLQTLSQHSRRLDEIIADTTLDDEIVAKELKELIAQRKRELSAKIKPAHES